jgi:phosphoglucomutase
MDAVIASALIVMMTEWYALRGMTLIDRWLELCETYGFYLEELHSAGVPLDRQKEIMERLRGGVVIKGLLRVEDYLHGFDGLPPADVLKLYFDGGGWAAVRPSGTEPKIKLYTGVNKKTLETAKAASETLGKSLLTEMGI